MNNLLDLMASAQYVGYALDDLNDVRHGRHTSDASQLLIAWFRRNPTIHLARRAWLECTKSGHPVPDDVMQVMIANIEKQVDDDLEKLEARDHIRAEVDPLLLIFVQLRENPNAEWLRSWRFPDPERQRHFDNVIDWLSKLSKGNLNIIFGELLGIDSEEALLKRASRLKNKLIEYNYDIT